MGANKTNKSIERASRAIGGVRKVVENFDQQVYKKQQSTYHTHKSSQSDEAVILKDLHQLKPFAVRQGRLHASFTNIAPDPLSGLDEEEFNKWLQRHKKTCCIVSLLILLLQMSKTWKNDDIQIIPKAFIDLIL